MPTFEEVTEEAKRLFKEKGGRDIEWGAVDQTTRNFYETKAAERLKLGNS